MAGIPSERLRDDGALGPWIWLPLVGLAVLVLIGTGLKAHGCAGGLGAEPLVTVFTILGWCGAMALFGAGIWRWTIVVARRARGLDRNVIAAVGLAVLLALVVSLADHSLFPAIFVGALGLGVLATLAALIGLIVRLGERRKADEAGALLPFYLLGTCVFVWLPFVFYEAIRVGGCFE
jgi:hypothetical protein